MDFSKRIHFSFLLILICSTIIALAGIKGFERLVPAINALNSRNAQSLYYCEQMLSSISLRKDVNVFKDNLSNAKNNITEPGEQEVIDNIEKTYRLAFEGKKEAEEQTIDYIADLAQVNRQAMQNATNSEKRLQHIGMWVIVFPTIFVWILGLMLLHSLKKMLIKPLEELKDVMISYLKGNHMRRCPQVSNSEDFQELYDSLNSILDSK